MFSAESVANIILHVVLISSFIVVFFFTYAAKIEEKIIKEQVDIIVKDLTSDLSLLPNALLQKLRNFVHEMKAPNMQKIDDIIRNKNKKLVDQVIKIIIGVVAGGLITVGVMAYYYKFSLKHLMFKNALSLLLIGVTEFLFLTYIGALYRSADPNFVKKLLVETVENFGKKNSIVDALGVDNIKQTVSNIIPNGANILSNSMDALSNVVGSESVGNLLGNLQDIGEKIIN